LGCAHDSINLVGKRMRVEELAYNDKPERPKHLNRKGGWFEIHVQMVVQKQF